MPVIKIHGTDIQFDANPKDTVLRAALKAGVMLPYECNSGGCGSCKFELIDGNIETLWDDPPGLTKRDIRKNKKLACQCTALDNCEIKIIPEQKTIPEFLPESFQVRYLGRRELTDDMAEFHFESDQAARFLPGQFAMLSLPGVNGDRAYSMSNTSNEAGNWQFIIKNMPGGAGSRYLFEHLSVGDVIDVDGPYGNSYLRTESDRDIVCIAGGSGLSPVMSIARSATSDKRFAGRKIYMFYGGKAPSDICTPELLDEIEPLDTELICYNATSDLALSKQQNWQGECCYIHELVKMKLGDSMAQYEFYFCGPPIMTNSVHRMLMIEYQVPFEQIHFDRFF
jgi:toluene monooxygenase electron transfer component